MPDQWSLHADTLERTVAAVLRRTPLRADSRHDFAQDLRLHFFKRLPVIVGGFAGRAKFETYLFKIGWSFWLDWREVVERRDRTTKCQVFSEEEAIPRGAVLVDERFDRELLAIEVCRKLSEALRVLDPCDAELIRLHYLKGYSIGAVARRAGVPHHRLYTRLETIQRRLKARLEAAGCDGHAVREAVFREPRSCAAWPHSCTRSALEAAN